MMIGIKEDMREGMKKDMRDYMPDDMQEEILRRIALKKKSREGIGKLFSHPVDMLTEKPENVLIISVPLALTVFIAGMVRSVAECGIAETLASACVDDIVVLALFIALTPYAVLFTRESMRIRSIEVALPNFFRDLAGMNESGMTLPNAVHTVSGGDYGKLTRYIKKMDCEISWNMPFIDAIVRFGDSLGAPLAKRSVDLVAKASIAGGNVSEVLKAAADDSRESVNLADERRNNMLIYVIIVIISFLVFLFIIGIMSATFLQTMADAGSALYSGGAEGTVDAGAGTAAASAFGGMSVGGGQDMDLYRRLFSHAAMIQAFFSGLVAGQMGEGNAKAGLKYSLIMLAIAWIAFRFFI
jgi:flagellar protein FlaJ